MAQISYTKFTIKPTTEGELAQMEVRAEVVGINKMSLVHDVIRATYDKAFKEQTPIGFAPPLSSQLSALRHGHDIDPGWVEVQKVLQDQMEQCCHRWPRFRLRGMPDGQHPRMATFKDNIDVMAKWINDAMQEGFSEVAPAENIKMDFAVVGKKGETAASTHPGFKPDTNGEGDFMVNVELPMLKHLYNHLTKGEPLPDGVLVALAQAIATAPGPIDLSDHMELLTEFGWTVCPHPRAEIEGVQYVAKTRKSETSPEAAMAMTADGVFGGDSLRGTYLRVALMAFETEHPDTEKIIHGAILTPTVFDAETFTPRRATLLRVMEPVDAHSSETP